MSNCETCKFLHEGEVQKDLQRPYFCYRFPPQVVAVPTPQGLSVMNFHPPVQPKTDWCGEHSPKIIQ